VTTDTPVGTVVFAGVGDEAGWSADDQAAASAALGWRAIELRTVGGVPLAELPDPAFGRLAATVASAGLRVVAVDSRIGGWARPVTGDLADDLRELDALARRCASLGARYIRIMSFPNDARAGLAEDTWEHQAVERVRRLVERAERAGLTLLHENCSGWAGRHADRALRLLSAVDSPALGLLFDTGNGIPHGYPPYDMLTELVPHVRRVHVKDAVGDGSDGDVRYVPPGTGAARVADCLRLLLAHGRAAAWSIEPHVAVRPHEHHRASPGECRAAFLTCGRALERLVADQVLPHVPGWRSVPGGLARVAP
jgi:sugar phosphate isomerase/epimerase